jgi:hypothetical protein
MYESLAVWISPPVIFLLKMIFRQSESAATLDDVGEINAQACLI